MPLDHRSAGPPGICVLLAAVAAGPGVARAAPAFDARPVGSVVMHGRVTAAVNVRGERVGDKVVRRWTLQPDRCTGSVCSVVRVTRERSLGQHDRLTLRRVGRGRYAGRGVFYIPLRCHKRVYVHGARVPYRITLNVVHAARVQSVAFARRVTATYVNGRRQDRTSCPLGPSHDAGRYTGRVVSALPRPPVARFSATVDPAGDVAAFTDASVTRTPGARLTAWAWNFGDPSSGSLDASAERSPVHAFSAPGAYLVTLAVADSNGLLGVASQQVTAPAPQPAERALTGSARPVPRAATRAPR